MVQHEFGQYGRIVFCLAVKRNATGLRSLSTGKGVRLADQADQDGREASSNLLSGDHLLEIYFLRLIDGNDQLIERMTIVWYQRISD